MPVQTRFHIRKKIFVLIICLIVSMVLWLLNDLNKIQTTTVHIPVRFSGLPYDMVPTNSLPSTVEASIEATGFTLLWRHFTSEKEVMDISLKLDQGGVVAGKNYLFNINYYTDDISRSLGPHIRVRRLFPDTFSVRFEKRFVKKVPVKLSADLQYQKEFYQSGDLVLRPDSVIISGAEEKVTLIDSVFTKRLILKQVKKSYEGNIELDPINGISYSVSQINVKLPVEQFTEKQISTKIIPTNVPPNYELNTIPDQATINLLVPISVFNSVSPVQFVLTVSFPDKRNKMTKLFVSIAQKPDYVKVVNIAPASVDFIVKAKQ